MQVAAYLLYLPMFFPDVDIAKPYPAVFDYMQRAAGRSGCPEAYKAAMAGGCNGGGAQGCPAPGRRVFACGTAHGACPGPCDTAGRPPQGGGAASGWLAQQQPVHWAAAGAGGLGMGWGAVRSASNRITEPSLGMRLQALWQRPRALAWAACLRACSESDGHATSGGWAGGTASSLGEVPRKARRAHAGVQVPLLLSWSSRLRDVLLFHSRIHDIKPAHLPAAVNKQPLTHPLPQSSQAVGLWKPTDRVVNQAGAAGTWRPWSLSDGVCELPTVA